VKRDQRIDLLDREVAAVRHHHAGVEQRPPGVGAEQTLRAESRAGPVHVACLVARLHGRNDAEGREARHVVEIEDLRVLHAEPVVGGRRRLERRRVGIEHEPIAAVADGVRVDLEAGLERARGDVLVKHLLIFRKRSMGTEERLRASLELISRRNSGTRPT